MTPNHELDARRIERVMERRSLRKTDFAPPPSWLRRQSLKSAAPIAWLWGAVLLVAGIVLFGLAKGWK